MKDALAKIVLPQIEALIKEYEVLEKSKKHYDWSGTSLDDASEFVTAGTNAIHRVVGPNSPLARRIESIIAECSPYRIHGAVPHVGGALKALRRDISAGYLVSVQELIHANVFADFLEMAEHLLNEGYKDPAAVLIGGVLEEHLRKLCDKNGIPTESPNRKGILRPRRADRMNADLAKGVYSRLDQKNITAWLDLRNKAAHGLYDKYTTQQVELLLQSVRDFLVRYPA